MCADVFGGAGPVCTRPSRMGGPTGRRCCACTCSSCLPVAGCWWPVIIRIGRACAGRPTLRDRKKSSMRRPRLRATGRSPSATTSSHGELGAGSGPGVGRRPCCLNVSAVPRRRSRRGPSSYAASARWCRRVCASCRCGTVSTAVRRLSRRRTISAADKLFRLRPKKPVSVGLAAALSRP